MFSGKPARWFLHVQEDIERRLEEGLNTSDPVDFEDLLRTKPDEVISYLADSGTVKLGSFTTEVIMSAQLSCSDFWSR
jgi:hypothetical protein